MENIGGVKMPEYFGKMVEPADARVDWSFTVWVLANFFRSMPGELVVNIGDMLQRLTNGVLRSTSHRVVNPEGLAPPVGFAHAVVAAPGRTVYLGGQVAQAPDGRIIGDSVTEQFEVIAMMLGKQLPKVEQMLREAHHDLLAFAGGVPLHQRGGGERQRGLAEVLAERREVDAAAHRARACATSTHPMRASAGRDRAAPYSQNRQHHDSNT